jgi:hypothetical protein
MPSVAVIRSPWPARGFEPGGMTRNLPAGDQTPHARSRRGGEQSRGHQSGGPRSGGRQLDASGQRCRVRVDSLVGVLAVVPHLLGFHPSSSLVVLGIGGPRAQVKLGFRYDLPDPPDPSLSGEIAAHATAVLSRQHISTAVVIGYGPGSLVTPVADLLRPGMQRAGLVIQDLLRVEDGRYWSYLCRDPQCCPVDGTPFTTLAHPAAAALRDAGLTALTDRAALARTLAPAADVLTSMSQATDRALKRAEELMKEAMSVPGGGDVMQLVTDAGRRAVQEAVCRYRDGGAIADHDRIAWLAITLADLRVRDDAWARMDPEFADAHRRLWTDIVRHARPAYVPAPAALLAFTAWQLGEGAIASMAIERALAADPGYSMALLLAEAIHAGLPPSAARLPMTPEEVAASYAGTERRRGSATPSGPRPESESGPGPRPESESGPGPRPESEPRMPVPGSRAADRRASSRPSG